MRTLAASTLFLFSLLCAGTSFATGYSWETLDYPDADSTFLYGIDNGKMVGWYRQTGGEGVTSDNGFLYDGSAWVTLNYHSGSDTHLHAIQGDKVVGSYLDGDGKRQGVSYDLQQNVWTPYGGSVNGAPASDIFGLDGDKMVGYSVDLNDVKHGSYFDGSQWNTLNYPGQVAGVANSFFHAINDKHIIGSYIDYGANPAVEHGIVYDTESLVWNELDHPDASKTYLYEIEGAYLVGAYKDNTGFHGFHYDSVMDNWQTIDHPQGTRTALHGIDGNSMVGFYHDSNDNIRGFRVTGEFGQTAGVPEPATLLLALLGLALLPRRKRR
jgi:hypothetical protein